MQIKNSEGNSGLEKEIHRISTGLYRNLFSYSRLNRSCPGGEESVTKAELRTCLSFFKQVQ